MLVRWLIMLVGKPGKRSEGAAAGRVSAADQLGHTWQCAASDQRYTSARCAMWTTSITSARSGMRNTTR
jgi:hypothetical protein